MPYLNRGFPAKEPCNERLICRKISGSFVTNPFLTHSHVLYRVAKRHRMPFLMGVVFTKEPTKSGSFAERDVQLKASFASS